MYYNQALIQYVGRVQETMDVRQKEYVQRSRANSAFLLLIYLLKNKQTNNTKINKNLPTPQFPFFLFPIGVTRTKVSLPALMCYVMLDVIVIFRNTEVITMGQRDNTPRITEERDK